MSLPANRAFILMSGWVETPFIARPSVNVSPVKPISSFKSLIPISDERDEGIPLVLRAFTSR